MNDLQVMTLRAAEQAGLKHYFTGKSCRNGHIGPRYVSTWRCVQCTTERVVAWQLANPEKKRAKQKRYEAKLSTEEKLRASRRDHRTAKQRKEIRLVEIAGRPRPDICDICEQPNTRRDGVIAFDHCHKHGHFRGWLCDRCNTTIGQAQDDPLLLRKMADYLEQAGPK